MKKIALVLFLGVLAVAATPATADVINNGGGQNVGSWLQQFIWVGTTIDHLTVTEITPGVQFEAPGINLYNTWTGNMPYPTVVTGHGGPDINFYFDLIWTTPQSTPLQFEWYGFYNGRNIDQGLATWDGNNWNFQAQTPSVPEPGSLALFGSGLLGLGSVVRRRYFGRM